MMTSEIAVRKSVTVETSQEHAFDVFVHQASSWWPPEHCLGEPPLKEAIVEPKIGGRWYEIDSRNAHCDWGHVVAYDAPKSIVLAWQISADFKYDPAIYTEVEVRFVAETPNTTRVELEHRGLEAYGDKAEAMRELFELPDAWQKGLDLFVKAANAR